MNKKELINEIASMTNLTKTDSKKALDSITNSISGALKKGERVAIQGFGSFFVVQRKARIGRNPRTGAAMNIAAKKVVRFKPSKSASPIKLP